MQHPRRPFGRREPQPMSELDGGAVVWGTRCAAPACDDELWGSFEPDKGEWGAADEETAGLSAWLRKGGFLIVDDFRLREWYNFEQQMRRVLPNGRIDRLDVTHRIFHSFFDIESLDMFYPHSRSLKAEFLGIHEDNDPSKRLMVVINYNNDIGDYMEHSGQGWWPVNTSNDAYKLAINYIMYGLTH